MRTDLGPGTSSNDVATVFEYLKSYGYFPNPDLARDDPSWRPAVTTLPPNPGVYDQVMTEAVKAFQQASALEPTGVVDQSTREALRTPRCGVPDDMHPLDPSDKFALYDMRWTKSVLKWKLYTTNIPPNLTVNLVRSAIMSAINSWAFNSKIGFEETTGTEDIHIEFAYPNSPSLARTYLFGSGGTILSPVTIYIARASDIAPSTWSILDVCPSGAFDLQSIIGHELGHALGIRHSSVVTPSIPVMYYGFNTREMRRGLVADDKEAVKALYSVWQSANNGAGRDIGVGANNDVWAIGTDQHPQAPNDFRIYKWRGSYWQRDSADGGAVRVAVAPDGVPWVVTSSGGIYKRTSSDPSTGSWAVQPGCAHDIGIGKDGSVWIVSCDANGTNYLLKKWNGSGWDVNCGSAVNVAVGTTGFPWLVSSSNQIWRKLSANPSTCDWQLLPDTASDVAVDNYGYAWILGVGGVTVRLWNEQSAITGYDTPSAFRWVTVPGSGSRISAGDTPWVTANSYDSYRIYSHF